MPSKLNFIKVISLLIRIVFAVTGFFLFVLSFFYGPDLNLLLVVGAVMIIVSGIPYFVSNIKLKILGIIVSSGAIILYAYLIAAIFKDTFSDRPPELSDTIYIIYILPLVFLGLLLFHFITIKKQL